MNTLSCDKKTLNQSLCKTTECRWPLLVRIIALPVHLALLVLLIVIGMARAIANEVLEKNLT